MFSICKKEMEWGGKRLSLETGKIARQSESAVVVRYAGTTILCAVTTAQARDDIDFFPLSVHYIEKAFAAGKFPGGFFKRENKPSEYEVLTSRAIDRSIRPMFDKYYKNEVQVLCTVLEYNHEGNPEIAATIGVSAALMLSKIPFHGPIGIVSVALRDGKFVINPSMHELDSSDLDLTVSGAAGGVLMVESRAGEVSEETMLEALDFAVSETKPVLQFIEEFCNDAKGENWATRRLSEYGEIRNSAHEKESAKKELCEKIAKKHAAHFKNIYKTHCKHERSVAIGSLCKEMCIDMQEHGKTNHTAFSIFNEIWKDFVRKRIVEDGVRIDGRGSEDIRQIECEVGGYPAIHGSALFTRGETQSFSTATLGGLSDGQLTESLKGLHTEKFLLHYNFPNYAVGEVGRVGAPGRREIGHGRLAWKALSNIVFDAMKEFPYVIRIVSEITESNGSSSMATVCGGTLALMDAGVPIKRPVSGIAMGLIKEGDKFVVLSDILGDEDHIGDMDFKVAGTENGITALQMDIKITGISIEIIKSALSQAKKGRAHILSEMLSKGIGKSRDAISSSAPGFAKFSIPVDKIKDLIGPGGKNIKELCEGGAKIDISKDGEVTMFAQTSAMLNETIAKIRSITDSPEVGAIYTGKVVNIVDFGAFVNFCGQRDGLVHISEISKERVTDVHDVLKIGDTVKVVVLGLDKYGKIKLSIKQVE